MNLRRLLWAGTAAFISYHLVANRDTIKEEVIETKELTDEASDHIKDINQQLAIIKGQLPKLTEMAQDLSQKASMFQHEVDIRTKQMPLLNKETNEKDSTVNTDDVTH